MRKRIYGPYAHQRGWRVVVIDADGKRSAHVCESYEEAHDLIQGLDADLEADPGVRVGTALERYAVYMAYKGNKPVSIATTKYRLRSFFGDVIWQPLRRLDRETCQRLYDRLVATQAVDTHRGSLSDARTFLSWCIRYRYLSMNPVDRLRGVGRRQHGKPQLRINEARSWLAVAKQLARAGYMGAVASMMALLMGMRTSEILRCMARDVDDRGRMLWIPVSKTLAGRRVLEIPTVLRPYLVRLAKGQPQLIRTHSLRGLHATLAIDARITPPAVASALGHASVRATLVSYADASTVTHARQRRVMATLGRRTRREGTPRGETRGKDGLAVDPETTKGPAFLRDP